MKTITQKEEQHAAACCSEPKNRYICISEESEGACTDTLFETLPISPLDSASIGYGNNGDDAEKPGIIVSERTELIQAGNCIGSPVYFFFNLNTAHLTDASQMLNLDELARVAKKYGLSLRVTGAADSSTGTPVLNGSLSTSRADYIVAELKKRGIPIERIVKVSRGGIADHVPVEVNRHTKVELFF